MLSSRSWCRLFHGCSILDDKQGFAAEGDSAGAIDPASQPGVLAEIDEDEIWAGLAALERARIAEGDTAASSGAGRDFVPKVRGGTSEILKSGIAVHASQGQCTNQAATDWARQYGQTTFKATFSEHGPAESAVLVRSWCHRMQLFFDMWLRAPAGAGFVYTDELVGSYAEPTELAALTGSVGHAKYRKWMSRIEVVRTIPRR